ELTYLVNSKAMFLMGTDISGNWSPLSGFIFNYPSYTLPQAELPYFLFVPTVGPFDFSLFNARIATAVLSISSVLLIYLVSSRLFDKKVGLASSFIAAINPWAIYMGRTSYEQAPAIFFYLLAFYCLLVLKGRKILFIIPLFFLAFYSYVATKVSFIPFVLISILFVYFVVNKRKYLKEYSIVLISCLFLVLLFGLTLINSSGPSRVGELITPSSQLISEEVDYVRKISIQNPLTNVLENKVTIFTRILVTKFMKSLSFDFLFINGDQFFSIFRHGLFYVLDAIFLALGLVAAFAYKRKVFWLLSGIAVAGILPQLAHSASTDNFSIHLSLFFAFITIFMGAGLAEALNLIKNKKYLYLSGGLIGVLYLFLVVNFFNIYFFQFPMQGNFDFHVRLLSKYVASVPNDKEIVIYSPSARDIFKKYIYYSNNYNSDTYEVVKSIYDKENFKFKNVNFLGCDNTLDFSEKIEVILYDEQCGSNKKSSHLTIPRLKDGGESYKIYNDSICKGMNLKRYPTSLSIEDFAIE
ncbi:MAG: glycosyltransferase family 39 protein, partial [Patescibacteria group bacterium]